jgi:hypothetical protein
MKLKDFFVKKNTQAKIKNEDFDKLVETFPDIDIPDVWVNLFDENFLTRDRASADFDIVKKVKAETLNGVDEKLKGVIGLLDAQGAEEFQKETNTFKKVESVVNLIPKLLEKAKGENPSSDERVKKLEQDLKEFANKLTSEKTTYESTLKELQSKHEQEKSGLKLDWTLDKKLSEYQLADEFSTIRTAIIKNVVDTVKGGNTLQLDDNGQIVVMDIDPTTKTAKPKFKGNDQVTIDSLLAEPLKPFLKKNNGSGGQQQQAPRSGQQGQTRTVADPNNGGQQFNLPPKAKPNTPQV